MFETIARRYDLVNDVLSLGIHRWWRKQAIRFANISPGAKVLDVCCGTGDMAFALARAVGHSGSVIGADFSGNMLQLAQKKLKSISDFGGPSHPLCLIQADTLRLPFEDQSFDVVTVAFGIRNVDDVVDGLAEMNRVLKPGGCALVLEFGQPKYPMFSSIYRWYSKHIMPFIGGLLSGNRAAYEYLPTTAEAFPAGGRFCDLMIQAGFERVRARSFFSGIAYAYMGLAAQKKSLRFPSGRDNSEFFSGEVIHGSGFMH